MIKTKLITYICALVCVLMCIDASAIDRHVSSQGNDGNDGTLNNPWQTVAHAAKTAVSGEVVYIHEGFYHERVVVTHSGTANNPIVFTNYQGGQVTIDGEGFNIPYATLDKQNAGRLWGGTFDFYGQSWIEVRNIRLQNCSGGSGFYGQNSHHILIDNCEVDKSRNGGIMFLLHGVQYDATNKEVARDLQDKSQWVYSTDITITNNEITRCVSADYGGWSEVVSLEGVKGFVVQGNHIHHNDVGLGGWGGGGECVDAKRGSSDGVIAFNRVHDSRSVGLYVEPWDDAMTNIKLYNNEVYNIQNAGIAIGVEHGGSLDGVEVFNNLIHHCSYGMTFPYYNTDQQPVRNVKVYNNTIADNNNILDTQWGPFGGIAINISNKELENLEIRNNIIANHSISPTPTDSTAGLEVTMDNNLFVNFTDQWGVSIKGTNFIEVDDAKFVDSEVYNYYLQSGSPAIGAASSNLVPANDFALNARPYGGSPDIGAYEYIGAVSTASPAAPSNLEVTSSSYNAIGIQWDDVNGEFAYRIEQKVGAGSWEQIGELNTDSTKFWDRGLSSATTFSYRVRAFNTGGYSNYSNVVSATTSTNPASTLTIQAENHDSYAGWTPDPAALLPGHTGTGYIGFFNYAQWNNVEVSATEDGVYDISFRYATDRLFYAHYNLFVNTMFVGDVFFDPTVGYEDWQNTIISGVPLKAGNNTIRLESKSGSLVMDSFSILGNPGATTSVPGQPHDLFSTVITNKQINLNWSAADSFAKGFTIERKAGAGPFNQIADVSGSTSNYSDVGLSASTSYTYRLRAYGDFGKSDFSNTSKSTTNPNPTTVPSAPNALVATVQSSSQIDLVWIDNSNAEEGYRVERSEGGAYTVIADLAPNTTSLANTGLSSSTAYTYRVYAYNALGSSSKSNTSSVTTEAPLTIASYRYLRIDLPADNNGLDIYDINWVENGTDYPTQHITSMNAPNALGNQVIGLAYGTDYKVYDDPSTNMNIQNGSLPLSIVLDLGAGNDIQPNQIEIKKASWSTLVKFTAYGSTDGTTWILMKEFDNISPLAYTSNVGVFEFGSGLPPSAPYGLNATSISSNQIDLTWTDTSDEELGYKVERKQGSGSFVEIMTLAANAVSFSNSGLSDGETYMYRLVAFNGSGVSAYSNTGTATTGNTSSLPAVPSTLTASAVSTAQINLNWTDNANNETGFKIEFSTNGSSYTEIATLSANATSYSSTGLSSSTMYYYKVSAYNSSGASAKIAASATTMVDPTEPNAPSSLSAAMASDSEISLTWVDNSNDETGFKIERKTEAGAFSTIATVAAGAASFADAGLSASTSYSYRVLAFNAVGNSLFSNISTATTDQAPPTDTYEAEANTSTDASFANTHSGYVGSGFMDYGTYVEWNNVNPGSAGTYNLVLRYANGSSSNRSCEVFVNGVNKGDATFGYSGSWSTWSTNTVSGVALNAGNNTIRVAIKSGFSGPNLDNMKLVSTGTSVSVTSVSVSPTTATLSANGTTQLTATVLPSNATNKSVTWTSSNTTIATVSASGLVTASSSNTGTATITVNTVDGNKTATSTITVSTSTVAVTGVSISPSSVSIAEGSTSTLTATATPSNATNKSLTWTSSNTAVATVSTSGVVTAVSAGSATITATSVSNTNLSDNSIVTVTGSTGGGSGFTQSSGSDGLVVMEAENYTSNRTGSSLSTCNYQENNDAAASNGKYMMVADGSCGQGSGNSGPHIDFDVNFVKSGTHYLWVRMIAEDANDDSCIPYYNATSKGNWYTGTTGGTWTWKKKTFTGVSTGNQTVSIYMREDGLKIDKLLLTTNDSYVPTGAESESPSARNTHQSLLEEASAIEISVYPNPAIEEMTLDLGSLENALLTIFDLSGHEMLSKNVTLGKINIELPRGVYLLKVATENQSFIKKVVFQ